MKLSEGIPWDELAEGYYQGFSTSQGRPTKDARLVIGAVIIRHKLCLSDEESVQQIQENPYLQYFVGLPSYQTCLPFVPSLFVEIRKRIGQAVFDVFQGAIIKTIESKKVKPKSSSLESSKLDAVKRTEKKNTDQALPTVAIVENKEASAARNEKETPKPQGKLILDATVVEQAIRYPTDLNLLNEARELSEQIIDILHAKRKVKNKKPRTYRQKARKAYLAVVKQRRPGSIPCDCLVYNLSSYYSSFGVQIQQLISHNLLNIKEDEPHAW